MSVLITIEEFEDELDALVEANPDDAGLIDALIEELGADQDLLAGLSDEVEILAAPGLLTIRPVARPRAGWAEAAAAQPPQGLLDAPSATRFDDKEWHW